MDTRGTAIVVGAGVIGLANAFRLARDGWRVSVLDPASGRGATWAAAGMIAPHAEISPGEEANFRRQLGAALAWRELSDELVQSGGQSIDLHVVGTLIVGFDGADRQLVEQLRAVALDFGVTGERVSRSDHSDLFRAITPRVRDGLYFDGDAWVDPDQIVASLTAAARALGVKFCNELVTGARADAEGVEVTTDDGIYRGDVGVWCTGSSPLPDGLAHRTAQSVRPVRGMTIRVRGVDRAGLATLRAYVRGRPWYFVSRSADYGVIGASSDEQADLGVELGELHRLLRDSLDLVPSFEAATLLEVREGLRPASADLEPFVEVVQGRWVWASGHYRHGVTLAPHTSGEVVDIVRGLT